jgi:hypothetical protein
MKDNVAQAMVRASKNMDAVHAMIDIALPVSLR